MNGIFEKLRNKYYPGGEGTPILQGIMAKLVLLYLALVFIVMIISGVFIYMQIRTQEANKSQTELRQYAQLIEDNVLQPGASPQVIAESFSPGSAILAGRNTITVYILDARGNIIAPAGIGIVLSDTVLISALDGTEKYDPWRKGVDVEGKRNVSMNYAKPVEEDGELVYVIYLSMAAEDIIANFSDVTNIIVAAVMIAMVLAVILGILFSRTLTDPIVSLTKTAKEMAQGNLDQEILVQSNDEIGQLTDSFNYMAKSLERTLSDMLSEKNRIEIILNNMTDGVLAYDADNTLIHANYASMEMLGIKDIEKVSFKDVMGILGLEIENTVEMDKEDVGESTVNIDDKYIAVSFNAYRNQFRRFDGVVLVLQDITKHTKLDNMRKEFVANVSHEIRTPLTTIKSYAETLLDGAMEDEELSKNFLNVINTEADRMTFLATDLLELTRFDNSQLKMNMEVTDLREIISNSIRQNTILAQQKEQEIRYEAPKDEMVTYCDPDRINQVLNNVISNAIKYSKAGTEIKIATDSHGKYFRIYITDQGVGVPKEDLKRIFERFYRVDKARSRAMGGTGLGLAIAKEIMDAHNGKISAVSEQGKGTTMILRFNKLEEAS